MASLRVRAIKIGKYLHASKFCRACELAPISFKVRMGFSIAEQRSTLNNALVKISHSSQTEQQAWQRYVQWHTAAGQCVTDRCEHFASLINIDAKILMTTSNNQPVTIVEKWLPNEEVVIGFDAQYNQTSQILTLCSIPYYLRRSCSNGQCNECLKQEAWCARKRIERNLVVIAELRTTPCRSRQDIAEWILIPTVEVALLSDNQYASCINVTFNGVYSLLWSTCFGTSLVAL